MILGDGSSSGRGGIFWNVTRTNDGYTPDIHRTASGLILFFRHLADGRQMPLARDELSGPDFWKCYCQLRAGSPLLLFPRHTLDLEPPSPRRPSSRGFFLCP